MKVLFVNQMLPPSLIKEVFVKTGKNPGFAIQKYHKLLVEGFLSNNTTVDVLCRTPFLIGLFDRGRTVVEDNVKYKILPYFKKSSVYHLIQAIGTFFYATIWSLKTDEGFIFCDVLCKSMVYGLGLSSVFHRKKIIGLVTDMPGMSHERPNGYKPESIGDKLHYFFISKLDGFVLISPLSDKLINPDKKPYMIMEGVVDHNLACDTCENKRPTIDFLYAGILSSVYGLDWLVKAFMRLKNDNVRLIIYGDGPYRDELNKCAEMDERIEYRGLALNTDVLKAEMTASFLVNPRPTKDEYTFYSFPSKNMEYMLSGTPVITNKLVSMPEEYLDKVILFKNESEDGYFETMQEYANMDLAEVNIMANSAQSFIRDTRNNIVQTKRILDFYKSIKSQI